MRGAQPATSAGVRLFCRKPDSGTLHRPAKSGEEINLELAALRLTPWIEQVQNGRLCEKSIALRMNVPTTFIRQDADFSELIPGGSRERAFSSRDPKKL